MKAENGSNVLCKVVEPYFERAYDHFCSHAQTPPDKESEYAAVVQKGNVITISYPIFSAYGKHASISYRKIIGNCIRRLLPEPLIRDNGPAHLETSVIKKARQTIVHLISFYPQRKTELEIVENPFPIVDMKLSVKIAKKPKRVFSAPKETDIPFEYKNGRCEIKITFLDGHKMIVFEE
jgi:hypothetical protein